MDIYHTPKNHRKDDIGMVHQINGPGVRVLVGPFYVCVLTSAGNWAKVSNIDINPALVGRE